MTAQSQFFIRQLRSNAIILKMKNYISYRPESLTIFKVTYPDKNLVLTYSPFQIAEQQSPYSSSRKLQISCEALLGVKFIKDVPFLVVAAQAFPCCTFPGETIYEIRKIEWIPIVSSQKISQKLESCEEQFQEISKLFENGHHYYCENYQINKPYHLNVEQENADQRKFYSQFIWNQSILTVNGQFEILRKWCKPIIQGYVEGFQTILPNQQKITYNVISRRSNKKAGTRYYARGIDDKGYVANFTQTQQIIFIKEYTVSHLQIRGSVPAFFEQLGISGLNGQLKINRSQTMTKRAFELHFQKLHPIFDKIICTNLLSIRKPQEQKLTVFFESLVDNYAPSYVKYQYFDFHDECRNNQFDNSKRLIDKIKDVIHYLGYYIIDNHKKKVLNRQKGVVRTNCLDCLDRTNYIQSRIALFILEDSLCQMNHNIRKKFEDLQTFKNKVEKSSEILNKFNHVWAENGDSISLHYTGIGSTHTDITKTGKRTFKGTVNHKMRSLMRFFTQFTDTKKHEAIHNLVTNPKMLRQSSVNETPTVDMINVVIMSYEVVYKDEFEGQNAFTEHYIEKQNPAIVVIGGYIPSETNWFKQIFKNNKNEVMENFIESKTNTVRRLGYQVVAKLENANSCLLVFGNEQILRNVSQIKHEKIEKFKDSMLITKFYVFSVSLVFCIANCHNFSALKTLTEKSFEEAFQKNKLGQARSSSILEHKYRTILGNIGSQNKIANEKLEEMEKKIAQYQEKRDYKNQMILNRQALDNDEFTLEYQSHQYLKNCMEGPLNFIPRHNRIIFWNQEKNIVKVFEYNRSQRKRCVFGLLGYELGEEHSIIR